MPRIAFPYFRSMRSSPAETNIAQVLEFVTLFLRKDLQDHNGNVQEMKGVAYHAPQQTSSTGETLEPYS